MDDSTLQAGHQLPAELTEQILSIVVNSYSDEDPAYTWTQLQRLSHFQKRRIEKYFLSFWLPKLVVTMYVGPQNPVDYTLVPTTASISASASERVVEFTHIRSRGTMPVDPECLQELWNSYSVHNPCAILRLGEGFIKHGFRGCYLMNDTPLPGLEVKKSASSIRFRWRDLFDALFREEMFLRRYMDQKLSYSLAEWKQETKWPDSWSLPNEVLVELLTMEIKLQRRVALLKHRALNLDPTGRCRPIFNEISRRLHLQKCTILLPDEERRGEYGLTRRSAPDIFEIVQQEESMVSSIPGWNKMRAEALLNLYAEEFGWACCIVQGRRHDVEFQQRRKKEWKRNRYREGQIEKELKINKRWNILV